ncbi:MAG: DNA methyltransferase [Candidatus Acidiferrales bacterium]
MRLAQKYPDSWSFSILAEAALDGNPVKGWTHNFYRYPARFSPRFAAAAIECFSRPSETVLDPYMGGATAVVEGMVAGRNMIGNDLNSLAAFIAKVKTTSLTDDDVELVRRWAVEKVPNLSYFQDFEELKAFVDPVKTKNLSIVRARFIKKLVAGALTSIAEMPAAASRDFAKCAVLRVAQWALDGRVRHTPLSDFRERLRVVTEDMLGSIRSFAEKVNCVGGRATIINMDASRLDRSEMFGSRERKVSLVVTSPPYPGVHVLYHRWQVDGRRETPAPYWIAGCDDSQGAAFYTFGDRQETNMETYFRNSLLTLQAIRRTMRTGAYMIQMLAFNHPQDQLPRYLQNMQDAGLAEVRTVGDGRIWRQVPSRKWHATLNGKTHSSNEVVLVHRAV